MIATERNSHGVLAAATVILLAIIPAAVAFGESLDAKINEIRARGDGAAGPVRLKVADELIAIGADPKVASSERLSALQYAAYHLGYAAASKTPGAIEKARDVYELYARTLRGGSDPQRERLFLIAYFGIYKAILAQDGSKDQISAALQVADEYAKLKGAASGRNMPEVMRAEVHLWSSDTANGIELLQAYLDRSRQAPDLLSDYAAYKTLIPAFVEQKRYEDALPLCLQAIEEYRDEKSNAASDMARQTGQVLRQGNLTTEQLLKAVPSALTASPSITTQILLSIAESKLKDQNDKEALTYAKLAYVLAPVAEVNPAMEIITRCLTAPDMSATKANAFLDFQKYGPAGWDGKLGTDDDLTNYLKDVPNPMPASSLAALEQRLAKTLPTEGKIYESLRDRGIICLALGKYQDALRAFRCAYAAAPLDKVKEGSALVPRALKAMDGSLVRANLYLVYQDHGPAGLDGNVGTEDDLKDPIAGVGAPALPPEVQSALRALAEAKGTDAEACRSRGYACLALGEYRKAFDQFRAAYLKAGANKKRQAVAIEDVASAIKAYDGHVYRANQYLLSQGRTPGAGGKPTDAAPNPMPVILKELEAAATNK